MEIKPLGKGRYCICLESEEKFALYKGEMERYCPKESTGEDAPRWLSQEAYRTILEEVLPERARVRALSLIAKRDYTTYQIREKLAEGFYPQPVIEAVLAELEDLGYLDDSQYAKDFIEAHLAGRGKRRLAADLANRGIMGEVFEAAYQEITAEGHAIGGTGKAAAGAGITFCPKDSAKEAILSGADGKLQSGLEDGDGAGFEDQSEKGRILVLLKKKGFSPAAEDLKAKKRMYGFLARRGFSFQDISEAMEEYSDWVEESD
ncbi:MAG: regulatory protein RecX [Lachnospiraceae bacterium]|nr:regulatory protein RecX [Lachnospiraceae bacterium]